MKDVIKKEPNPRYENAVFEVGMWFHDGPNKGFTPSPFRYDDPKAGNRHIYTQKVQPEAIPPFLVTLADGTVMESF